MIRGNLFIYKITLTKGQSWERWCFETMFLFNMIKFEIKSRLLRRNEHLQCGPISKRNSPRRAEEDRKTCICTPMPELFGWCGFYAVT